MAIVRSLLIDLTQKWLGDSVSESELALMRDHGVSPSGLLAPFHDALVPGITPLLMSHH